MSHNHGSEAACSRTELRCATKVTPAFGQDGTLWLVWMAGGQISVGRSNDAGHRFSPPAQVTQEQLDLDWGPDARPKIAVDRSGDIVVAFSTFRDKAFNGEVFYSRSTNGGRTFDPQPITQTPKASASRHWDLMQTAPCLPHGSTSAIACRSNGPARSTMAPHCFSRARKMAARPIREARLAADNTCECCRLGARIRPVRPSRRRLQKHL